MNQAVGRGRGRSTALAAALLILAGCTAGKSPPPVPSKTVPALRASLPQSITGRWFAFSGGRAVPVTGPTASQASYRPWTVQTRVAGMLQVGRTVYVAVNGWGLMTVEGPGAGGQHEPAFAYHEQRALFGERTINGFFRDGKGLTVNLYRNRIFDTASPLSTPLTYARYDAGTNAYTPVTLSPTSEGWEPIEVIRDRKGDWALAWKKIAEEKVSFQYSLYTPATNGLESIDRKRFLAAYGFEDISRAPAPVRAIAREARGGAGFNSLVLHLVIRDASRIERYRSGSQRGLESGNAGLVTVPVVRAEAGYFALLPGGRLMSAPDAGSPPGSSGRTAATDPRSTAARTLRLPPLPRGYAYTGLWTDGRLLVISWEQQRFTQVGAAGLFLAILPA